MIHRALVPDWVWLGGEIEREVGYKRRSTMEKMNQAFEKVKILVGMEDDEQSASSSSAPLHESGSFSFVDMDEFNRNCTLSTKQV